MNSTLIVREKIGKLKQLAQKDGELQLIFDRVMLYYPALTENPEEATENMIKGYNSIIENNITSVELRNSLTIK